MRAARSLWRCRKLRWTPARVNLDRFPGTATPGARAGGRTAQCAPSVRVSRRGLAACYGATGHCNVWQQRQRQREPVRGPVAAVGRFLDNTLVAFRARAALGPGSTRCVRQPVRQPVPFLAHSGCSSASGASEETGFELRIMYVSVCARKANRKTGGQVVAGSNPVSPTAVMSRDIVDSVPRHGLHLDSVFG
jgi:hypothetical protein